MHLLYIEPTPKPTLRRGRRLLVKTYALQDLPVLVGEGAEGP